MIFRTVTESSMTITNWLMRLYSLSTSLLYILPLCMQARISLERFSFRNVGASRSCTCLRAELKPLSTLITHYLCLVGNYSTNFVTMQYICIKKFSILLWNLFNIGDGNV